MTVLVAAAPAVAGARLQRAERVAIAKINRLRADSGLRKVRPERRLARAATAHSRDMLQANFFDHFSSNGTSAYDRIRSYRRSSLIGETLAYRPWDGSGGGTARAIVRMWIASPPHLAVLTTGSLRRIGISRRRGTLFGQRVMVWTADLASRR